MASFSAEVHEAEKLHVEAQQLFAQQQYGLAAARWKAGLSAATKIPDVETRRRVQATLVGSFACAVDLSGDPQGSITWHEKAFNLHGRFGDFEAQGSCMCNCGNSYMNAGNLEKAFECFSLAKEIATTEGIKGLFKQVRLPLLACTVSNSGA
jgi:hypothetical protein